MPLHIIDPGLQTLVVDLGRPHSRSLGVPVGGPADRKAFMLGNALVGNPLDAAALEITLAGPTLRADVDLGCVVFGAPFEISTRQSALQAGKAFTLPAGEELRIGGTPAGVRGYFCVRGGLRGKAVLGSQSSLQPLRVGAELDCNEGSIPPRFFRLPADEFSPNVLRTLPGPQADWFRDGALHCQPFTVTPASNRMGLRLRGEPLPPREPSIFREIASEPVSPGAVQVSSDGQCIVLGVDGQTIGGYPKVAHVISADLDRLAQLRPGQVVRFVGVSLVEAETLYRSRRTMLKEWAARLHASIAVR